jgi:hypothetical protein
MALGAVLVLVEIEAAEVEFVQEIEMTGRVRLPDGDAVGLVTVRTRSMYGMKNSSGVEAESNRPVSSTTRWFNSTGSKLKPSGVARRTFGDWMTDIGFSKNSGPCGNAPGERALRAHSCQSRIGHSSGICHLVDTN